MTHPEDTLIPVILSGGTGSRLWPVSREAHPKPFMRLPDGETLLQKTFLRAMRFSRSPEVMTITNREYYLKSKADYKAVLTEPITTSFLLEPFGRNTAPAITLAALKALANYGPEAILLVLPADHLIENTDAFDKQCAKAITLAKDNRMVTFGIMPTAPETGFGYIEFGDLYPAHTDCHQVRRFVEKPDAALANTLFQSSQYLWNAGMFCFKAGVLINELNHHAPQILQAARQCWEKSRAHPTDPYAFEFDPVSFAEQPDISIDYALMEKSQEIAVIACQFGWQDIGSWEAYKKLHPADSNGNTVLGDAILIDSQNNFIHSESRMVASIGVQNLAIIDTPDALLITHRDRTQDVKQVVQTLKEKAHQSYLMHRTVIRPWGSYTVLEEGHGFKIKRIVVKPEASLSLQMHHHRSEHWVVVEGTAQVLNGKQTILLNTNESTFVPVGTPHRLSNPGKTDLVIIEVQTGQYLGEDDIVRFEDTYGRVT